MQKLAATQLQYSCSDSFGSCRNLIVVLAITKSSEKLIFCIIMALTETPNYYQFWHHNQNWNRISVCLSGREMVKYILQLFHSTDAVVDNCLCYCAACRQGGRMPGQRVKNASGNTPRWRHSISSGRSRLTEWTTGWQALKRDWSFVVIRLQPL